MKVKVSLDYNDYQELLAKNVQETEVWNTLQLLVGQLVSKDVLTLTEINNLIRTSGFYVVIQKKQFALMRLPGNEL